MGRLQSSDNRKPRPEMDVDPRPPATWNCPSYVDAHPSIFHLQEGAVGPIAGSPPPAADPKVLWNEQIPDENAQQPDRIDLASRVQDMRLQPPQPMIICESVEDVKTENNEATGGAPSCLSVPKVDLTFEKKRPPL